MSTAAIRTITVHHGKGGHERVLPLSDETLGYLDRYLSEWSAKAGVLIQPFPPAGSGPLNVKYLFRITAQAMHSRWAVGNDARARHTMATDPPRNGAHLRDAQAALGHS
jgi:site-specific recombinase XerD